MRLKTPVSEDKLIPVHQFGFRNNHSTIEQVNKVFNVISNSIEKKKSCSAAFLDIQQAFDKVWHPGLLYKIKTNIPRYFLLFKSYLYNRRFYVQHGHDISECHPSPTRKRAGTSSRKFNCTHYISINEMCGT